MASKSSMGHGMRRRTGEPSNYLESLGNSMSRSHKTHSEHYSDAAAAGSHRVPMGDGSLDMSVYGQVDEINPSQMRGTLVPKKGTQAMDPTAAGTKQNRQNIEKIGATYRISPKSTFVQLDPSAGPTMASARVIPSVASVNRSFQDAEGQSYL